MSFVPITATGGTISTVVIDGDAYRLHTFTSTGNTNFVVTDLGDDANIEFLLVAGGGGGGGASNDRSEAGFGGQVITSSGSVSIETYTVTVGAGGTGVFWAGSAGAGANSSISGTGISSSSQGGKGGDSRACCPSQVVAGQAGFIGGPTTTNFTGSSVTYGSNGPTSALNAAGTNGASNTGNGGSDNWNQGNGRGGDGGSGIVIVKYLLEPATSFDDSEVSEIIENGVRYRVHQFKKVGTSSFVVQSPTLNIEYLIVAGGGAGGASFNTFASGGGGGGGGVLAGSLTANTGIYEITVGAGGLGATGVADSNPGANTSAFELTAIGGGRGARWLAAGNPSNAGSGGSGGGGANASGLFNGGAGTTGQGNAGGDGVAYSANASSGGGGGGGKSTAGSPATASSGGLGGEGLLSTITGRALVYGSGGGGGHGLFAGAGGTRAGSGASGNANGFSAEPNSGGGGGGAGNGNGGSFTSGNGGSGIVIIRYVIDDEPLPGNTLYVKSISLPTSDNGTIIEVQSPSYILSRGSPIQVNYFRTDERSQWSAPVGLIGTPVRPAGLSITPKKRNSLIVMTWMLNGEVHWETVWDIYVQNAVASMSQFEGYNRQVVPRQRWAGYVSGYFDTQGNTDSTMESFFIQYSMIAPTTETLYFYPAIRASGATAYTFSLNRCAGALGQDSYENAITTGMIMEIPQ
jgi:hypothetical protein